VVAFTFAGDGARYAPRPLTPWQIQLSGDVDTSILSIFYMIVDADVKQSIKQELMNRDVRIGCYLEGGVSSDKRGDESRLANYTGDAVSSKDKTPPDSGKSLYWLDIRERTGLQPVWEERLEAAKQTGCDSIIVSYMDGYKYDTGFNLTGQDQRDYNIWFAELVHHHNMSVALYNAMDQTSSLAKHFDFAVVTQCFETLGLSCGQTLYSAYTSERKAVFGVSYLNTQENQVERTSWYNPSPFMSTCPLTLPLGMAWLYKDTPLNAFPYYSCELNPSSYGDRILVVFMIIFCCACCCICCLGTCIGIAALCKIRASLFAKFTSKQ
jgi:hypothetical protein